MSTTHKQEESAASQDIVSTAGIPEWTPPAKRINSQADMLTWKQSEAYARLLHFIKQLNTCSLNRRISDPCHESEVD
jgi:hypothetical protein